MKAKIGESGSENGQHGGAKTAAAKISRRNLK